METIDSVTSAIKGHVRLAEKFDTGDFLLFAITELTDNGTTWTLDVTNEASGGSALIDESQELYHLLVQVIEEIKDKKVKLVFKVFKVHKVFKVQMVHKV